MKDINLKYFYFYSLQIPIQSTDFSFSKKFFISDLKARIPNQQSKTVPSARTKSIHIFYISTFSHFPIDIKTLEIDTIHYRYMQIYLFVQVQTITKYSLVFSVISGHYCCVLLQLCPAASWTPAAGPPGGCSACQHQVNIIEMYNFYRIAEKSREEHISEGRVYISTL